MQLKNSLKKPWLIAVILEVILCLIIIAFRPFGPGGRPENYKNGVAPLAVHEAGSADENAALEIPVRLKIPKLNVDADLESAGLTPQGELDVPKDPKDAAWYNLGPRPGDKGNAIISGHYGFWKNGEKAAFNDLSKLEKGDSLFVEDKKGAIITFVVRDLRTFNSNETVPEVFYSSDGKAHLNLITCSGVWNKNQKVYSDRLVVFTDKKL